MRIRCNKTARRYADSILRRRWSSSRFSSARGWAQADLQDDMLHVPPIDDLDASSADETDHLIGDYDLDAPEIPSGGAEGTQASSEFWLCNGSCLVCHHLVPRTTMYTPGPHCHCPLDLLDIHRRTLTSIAEFDEREIEDYWDGSASDICELSES